MQSFYGQDPAGIRRLPRKLHLSFGWQIIDAEVIDAGIVGCATPFERPVIVAMPHVTIATEQQRRYVTVPPSSDVKRLPPQLLVSSHCTERAAYASQLVHGPGIQA